MRLCWGRTKVPFFHSFQTALNAAALPKVDAEFKEITEGEELNSFLGCVALFDELIKLSPKWDAETLKVVMTGSAEDGPEWHRHIGNKT